VDHRADSRVASAKSLEKARSVLPLSLSPSPSLSLSLSFSFSLLSPLLYLFRIIFDVIPVAYARHGAAGKVSVRANLTRIRKGHPGQ